MANYLLKYKGTYRLKLDIDQGTNDYPRNEDGSIEDIDMYISCQYGNKIFNYGNGVLTAYIPSIGRGRNILKAIQEQNIDITNIEETDEEVLFRFKAKNIEPIACLLKAKTSGANISPVSMKNLPKSNVKIPTDEIERYKEISSKVDKGDLLIIYRITNDFLSNILEKRSKKTLKRKDFDYKSDMKKMCLGRQTKEYIYVKNFWDEYLEYLKKEIDKFYKNK